MTYQGNDRRQGADFWLILSRVLAIVGWLFFIVALVVSFYAAPEIEYGVIKYHGVEVRKVWQPRLTNYLFLILWFNALASFSAIVINRFRTRRVTDINPIFNLVLLLLTSIAWAVYIYFDIR